MTFWFAEGSKSALSRASEREREGTHRAAMGRVREGQASDLKTLTRPPPLRGAGSLSRFKARERELGQDA
jgi:hypothetical protein